MAAPAGPQISDRVYVYESEDFLDIGEIAPIEQEPFMELIQRTVVPNILKDSVEEGSHLACYLIGRVTAEDAPPRVYDALSIANWIQIKSRTIPFLDDRTGKLDASTTDPLTRKKILNIHTFTMLKLNVFHPIAEYQEVQKSFYTMNFWRLLLETHQQARDNGTDEKLIELVRTLFFGKGCKQSDLTGMEYLKYGASRRKPNSLFFLGHLFERGERGLNANPAIAELLFARAADEGHNEARCRLAHILLESQPNEERKNKAIALLNIASEEDFTDAQYTLGTILLYGFYQMPPHKEKAISLIRQAARKDHERALHYLSSMGIPLTEGTSEDKE